MSRPESIYHRRQAMTPRLTLGIILVSESIFFGTLLSAYLFLRANQPDWPLIHASLQRLLLPGANTLILLVSALTAGLGLRAIRKGKIHRLVRWLWMTLFLGWVFVGGQVFDFISSGMRPSDQLFGGVFFTLMGFHALHVLAGIIMMIALIVRTQLGDFSINRHVAIEIGAWFWYFVVVVWAVLFSALYLL